MGLFSIFSKKPESGLPLAELGRRLKLDPVELAKVPLDYREVRIPKRNGDPRVLHVPNDRLMSVQRTILRRLLARLSAHPAALGFERGQSIATHARAHVGATVLVKMDIRDFFPKTTAKRVREYLVGIGWGGEVADLLLKLTTHRGALPQGAPTSPRLSNLVNYPMDTRLFAMALSQGAKYSRYADDMTFSFKVDDPAKIGMVLNATDWTVHEYGYVVHMGKKLRIARRYERMLVTGLVVNDCVNLPRETRRRLRAVEHRLSAGKPTTMTAAQLQGWRALQQMVAAQRNAPP